MGGKTKTQDKPGGKDAKANPKGQKGAKGNSQGNGKGQDEEKTNGKLKGAQKVAVKHILCGKHSKKEEALTKLRSELQKKKDSGKNTPAISTIWQGVAEEFAEEKPKQGGDLGRPKPKGTWHKPFEDVAFNLQMSTEKDLVLGEARTEEGYHIIIVTSRS